MKNIIKKNILKIAILRANGLGDFIVTLPAIEAIRLAYPLAEIVLLGKPWHAGFLIRGRTPVDRVVIVPVCRKIREEEGVAPQEKELLRFFGRMRKEKFGIVLHFQGQGVAANSFIRKMGARITVGHTCRHADPVDRSIPYDYYQSEVIRYQELAWLIGAKQVVLEPRIGVLREDRNELREFFRQYGVIKPYIVLNTQARDLRRVWPPENFARLAGIFLQKGYRVICTGQWQEHDAVQKIVRATGYRALNACKALSLGGLTGLLAESALVVSNDTGPLHLARAVGARTVGIYWGPNFINWGPLLRGNHRPVISWNMHCPGCGIVPNVPYPFEPRLPECDHSFSFVKDITVDEVIARSEELLPAGDTATAAHMIHADDRKRAIHDM